MAKYSMKQNGKEVGPASVYAEPHTMDGKKLTAKDAGKPQSVNFADEIKMSVGRIQKAKTQKLKHQALRCVVQERLLKALCAEGRWHNELRYVVPNNPELR